MLKHNYKYYKYFLLTFALAGGIITLSSCSKEEKENNIHSVAQPMSFEFSNVDSRVGGASRATAESGELISSIGMSCYTGFWDAGTSLPNFFYNEEIAYQGSNRWQTTSSYLKPATGTRRRFFAYYPFVSPTEDVLHNLTISAADAAGSPTIDYTIHTNVADQQDLLVGWNDEDAFGQGCDVVHMKMYHMMTAVRFTIDESVPAGYIRKITISDVADGGHFVYDDELKWNSVNSTLASYSLERDIRTGVGSKVELNADEVFMMMPQYLNDKSAVTIIYDNGQVFTLSSSLDGKEWERGKLVTYNIKISSLFKLSLETTIEPWVDGDTFNWTSGY